LSANNETGLLKDGSEHRKSKSILVVDDDESVGNLVVKLLERAGHHSLLRLDGQSALDVIKEGKLDLVITDLRMPGMDGIELIRRTRKINKKLDVIVITGYGTMEIFIEAMREGARDFIIKPIEKDQFLNAIDRALHRKGLEDSLLARTQQLVQAEKMATVGVLSAGIAHEINNPNTFIRTNLQLMNEYIKRLKPRLEDLSVEKNVISVRDIILKEFPDMINEALKGTERIQKIVAGVKHYAHKGDGEFAQVDIREVIAHAVTLVRARLRKNVTITESYLNLKEIKGEFSKLEQVFVNLLVNAADAIEDKVTAKRAEGDTGFIGLIDVSATIIEGDDPKTGSDSEYLILTFYDNGPGIPKEKIKKVFDPFFTTKPVGVGTGLGLYISYEIIMQHGGEITIQSEPGEGTAFVIKLPVEEASPKKRPENAE